MRGDSIAEAPVQKSKTEIEKLPKGVYRVISQLPFRGSVARLEHETKADKVSSVVSDAWFRKEQQLAKEKKKPPT